MRPARWWRPRPDANEFAFRLNEGNVKAHTLTRLDAMIVATAGKRLTYKALIA